MPPRNNNNTLTLASPTPERPLSSHISFLEGGTSADLSCTLGTYLPLASLETLPGQLPLRLYCPLMGISILTTPSHTLQLFARHGVPVPELSRRYQPLPIHYDEVPNHWPRLEP